MSTASQPPDAASASSPEPLGKLRVEVPHWSAEIHVVDNLYRPVTLPPLQPSGAIYVTETLVPAGVYDVDVRMGVKTAEASLIVRPGKRPAVFSEKDWGDLPTESTPLVSNIPV